MLLLIPTVLVGCLLVALFLFYKKQFQFWEKLGFPHTKPEFIWGDARGIGTSRSIGQVIHDIYVKFPNEPFVGTWLLFAPNLLIRDAELIKNIFVRDFMTFHDRGMYYNEKDDPLSAHLVTLDGTKWRNTRVKMTPTFTSGKIKMMFPILAECSKRFEKVLEEPAAAGKVIGVKDYAARFTTDVISLVAFGIDTDSLHNPNSEFRTYGRKVFELTYIETLKNFLMFMVPSLSSALSLTIIRKEVSNFFLSAFGESMEYREKNKIRRNDFLDLLIQLKNKGKLDDVDGDGSTKFTFEEAAAQAFVFFAAGFETSSTTMQFALYELAKNPEIQEKAREEVRRVLDECNGEISYEAIGKMEYLSRVVDETLRMYPPLPFLQRQCNKNYKIPNSKLVIPKGVTAFIDVQGMHYDPQHYPNPQQFDPDRFTEEVKATRHHYAYLPFGEGPRNCIGMRFGLLQSALGMATLLKSYRFSVAKETQMTIVYDPQSVILSPKNDIYIRISKA